MWHWHPQSLAVSNGRSTAPTCETRAIHFNGAGDLPQSRRTAIPHSTCWRLTVTMGHSPISKCRPRKTTSRSTDRAKPRSGTHAASPVCAITKRITNTQQDLTQGTKPSIVHVRWQPILRRIYDFKFSPSHTALDSRSVLAGTGLSHQSSPYLNMDPHLE